MTTRIFEEAWRRIDRYPWRDYSFQVWLMRIVRDELGGAPRPAPEPDGDPLDGIR